MHLCDGDAQLYRVVARNIVERGAWLDLTYTPAVHPRYREHLPFGLWPTAAAIRALGEDALPYLDGFWTFATIAVLAAAARRLFGTWAAAGAVLVLGTTDAFSVFCAFPRLDGATALFSLLSALPWLFGIPSAPGAAAGALAAALACAVKGPFGLLMLAASGTARALVSRSWRALWTAALLGCAAALPVLGFLLYQRLRGDASWWDGYVGSQLLASLEGGRGDGRSEWWFPFLALSRQFWPGLAVVPFAAWRSWRRPEPARRAVALAFGLGLLLLCLPGRKVANHLLILYPVGALWAGETVGGLLEAVFSRWRHARKAIVALAAVATAGWILVVVGTPLWIRASRCLPRSGLSADLAALRPGTSLLLVSTAPQWREVAALAAERRLVAWPVHGWAEGSKAPGPIDIAVVAEPSATPAVPGWTQTRRVSGWSLWQRDGQRDPEPAAAAH